MRKFTLILASMLLLLHFMPASLQFSSNFAEAADLTTQYRVYQKDRMLQEFVDKEEAIRYAKRYMDSYVEEIGTRKWIWSYFPPFQVYQFDRKISKRFPTLEQAIQEAKKWAYSSVKNITSGGWVWDQYPRERYRVYQGETTLKNWGFEQLADAKIEAKKWANSHILDLNGMKIIWDNLSEQELELRRGGIDQYRIFDMHSGEIIGTYAYLGDAIQAASEQQGTQIYSLKSKQIIYENVPPYTVLQNGRPLQSFYLLDDALAYAKKWANGTIEYQNREIWSNVWPYHVYQSEKKIKSFRQIEEAVHFALTLEKAFILTADGEPVWDNQTQLKIWGWTGETNSKMIKDRVLKTDGLDVISPTWFRLDSADGKMSDLSDPALVKWLHARGLEVHPLVHNQFDEKLTTAFLQNQDARINFIKKLIESNVRLGVEGINVDFEGLAGSDRTAYTQFIKELTNAAHAANLTVSIDLPRGDLKWNKLTAYDHAILGQTVDHVVIMAYDQHYSGSTTPGSVSGLDWAEKGIQEFLSYGISRDSLVMGVPFYVRLWQMQDGKLAGNRAIYTNSIEDLLKDKTWEQEWDPKFSQYRISYEENGYTYLLWLEDDRTLQERLNIAKKYGLHGAAAWRLGQEPEHFWNTILYEK